MKADFRQPVQTVITLLALLTLAFATGCQTQTEIAAPDPKEGAVTVYVISNGWHTGFVLARSDLPAGALPEADDFPGAPYLEVDWGDATYFPAREKSLGLALSAALTPTPAVVHLVGLPAHPRQVFPGAETVPIELSSEGFRKLIGYLDGAFARDGAPRVASSAPGLYRFSRFYPATGTFHLFNTCNTWTARGLAGAGLPIRVGGVIQAEELMVQLRGKKE